MAQCLKCGTELAINEEGIAPVLCDPCAGVATSRARRTLRKGTFRDYPITTVLFALCVMVFLIMVVTDGFKLSLFASGFSFENSLNWGANFGPLTIGGQYWRLVTYEFVHGNILHIVMNMWCLWSLGQLAERLFGGWQTAVIYILTGVGGGLASLAYEPQRWSVGASGAIFGITGAILSGLKFGDLSVTAGQRRSAISSMVTFVIISFAWGGLGNTDNMCHLGGFVSGLIIGLPLSAFKRKNRSLQAAMLVVTALGLAAATKELVQRHGHPSRLFTAEYYVSRQNFPAAIETLQKDLVANPDSAETYAELARVYYLNHEPQKADAALKKAAQLDPSILEQSDDDDDNSQTTQPAKKD